MKRILLRTSLLLIILMNACSNGSNKNNMLVSGINKEYLDTTANPADNFYQYACGGWMKMYPLTPEHSRYGSFDKLIDDNQLKLKELIVDLASHKHKQGSIAQKIGDLYNLGMDSAQLQKQGADPIVAILSDIAKLSTKEAINEKITELHSYGINPFFGIFAEANPSNSNMTIAWMWQAGMGMGDKDYYLEKETKEIREKYKQLIQNMFLHAGFADMLNKKGKEAELAEAVLNLETCLAKASMDRNTLRDPYKTYNYMHLQDVQNLMKNFNLNNYFTSVGLSDLDSVNVGQPDYIKEVGLLLDNTDYDHIKAYLAWNVINNAANYLSDKFVDEKFEFYGKVLSGKEELQPKWKRVINTVDDVLGEAVGQMYVEKYFPKEAKERMLNLVDNLKYALAERIKTNTWMTDTTKEKAIEKLNAFHVKIGYPDKWRDYSKLTIERDNFYANILRSNKFEIAYQLSKINKPVDKTLWLMTPQTVNAYYNPTTNEICFPAAILQPPFFDMNADDAANYGAIGVVIGHEMTHGFDDKGRQYDKDGNLNDWWTPEDADNFSKRAQVLVDYFNKIEVFPGVFADGQFTLGENIADNGGLQVSFIALQKAIENGEIQKEMDGFTPQQRFFIAYATVWASNIRDEEIKRRTKEDPHSLGKWRVNGTLPHIQTFIDAFGIKEGNKMYLPPKQRVAIW
ncbi:MAG: M13 family metallopeptidase [Bacteroidales bacterium]|jgi:putative endopeptidase|nr:M13 family metallopeptidase [Bacteroidales bacterium]